jgi:hypothetical protein
MASIEEVKLDIKLEFSADRKKRDARYTVSCKVFFTENEVCLMSLCSKGMWFAVECDIWGADPPSGRRGDNRLLFVRSWRFPAVFPDQIPTGEIELRHSEVLPERVFNEDYGPPPGGDDEVYARFVLENMFSRTVVDDKDSNIVYGQFYNWEP